MRVVVQRVREAHVTVNTNVIGKIGKGFLLLVSAGQEDQPEDSAWMTNKILNLRVFPDEDGKMNLSIKDIDGEILAVSQFTLHGDCRKGHRPSFVRAMEPVAARIFFDNFVKSLRRFRPEKVATGEFGAHMQVSLVNDGPVTLLLDSEKQF